MTATATSPKLPHIVVLGAGFGGINFCQSFDTTKARITIVDRQNHHLFQPLLYQVATAGLSAPDIAQPIRAVLSGKKNLTVLMDEIESIDLEGKRVQLSQKTLDYDYLILALGGATSYFGKNEWEQFAPGLKSLKDALHIRHSVLMAFEQAENTSDKAEHDRLMTMVVVGGGPTGVELAGAFSELARTVLASDFAHIDPKEARVILIEAAPRILTHLPTDLSESAVRQLENLGVEVRVNSKVLDIRHQQLDLPGETIHAANIFWTAGVGAAPITKTLGVELDRGGRVKVEPDCSIPGHPEAFAIGDIASMMNKKTNAPVPGVSPAAIQMSQHVAQLIEDELDPMSVRHGLRLPFEYWDKGTMATIGRSSAVAMIGKVKFSGFIAWLAWLAVHLLFLVGFRNRLSVLMNWAYAYFTYKRGSRIITYDPAEPPPFPARHGSANDAALPAPATVAPAASKEAAPVA
ncbi:FAD-dependent oxidoreductase [Verrucomicrobia bacterium LW23]|nr:FAD-dependent oxidoreductase [Verrucomicrobia bacterium LW23]